MLQNISVSTVFSNFLFCNFQKQNKKYHYFHKNMKQNDYF